MGKAIDDEVLLALAKKGGGGGGGTDDYEDLSHKPQVNGHTLEGNKTTSDLGIKFEDLPDAPTIPNDLADLQDDSSHRLVTDTEKATWNNKSDFSGAYADLTGLPTLGTASAKNVPASGDAGNSEVVLGSDSRLTDSRPASDVSSWAKQPTKPSYTSNEVGAIATTQKGVASGVAELDANGKVPSSQLPSYVDDTIEGYLYNDKWYSDSQHTQEVTGESGKIYVELATNKTYRWSGSIFVEISESLALGETSSTAYRGDRGKTAYDHSQTTGNPHGTTKSDVGLSNVPNVSTNDQEPTFTEASTRNNIASGEKLSVIFGKIQKFFNDLKTVAFTGNYSDLVTKLGIKNSAGTDLTARNALQFTGGLSVSDDSTNERTVVSDDYELILWEDWQTIVANHEENLHPNAVITGVPDADGDISVELMTKLWENSSPSSAMASGTAINLSDGDYDFRLVIYCTSTTGTRKLSKVVKKGDSVMLDVADYSSSAASNRVRNLDYVSATQYVTTDATKNGSVDNTLVIPIVIYGIKTTASVKVSAIAENVSTSADKCMLSDGVTSVEDRLDANTLGIPVDIISYTTSENAYICPSDGYIWINSNSNNGYVYVNIGGITTASYYIGSPYLITYVKKGMKVYISGVSGTANVRFYPLS